MTANCNPVVITAPLELSPDQALALAQFCKRLTWQEIAANAVDRCEAEDIKDSILSLQSTLADAGYAPR